jgi:N6-L-threonylcarbamoyladenine synthase
MTKAKIILGIETSCDETAISLVEIRDDSGSQESLRILSNVVLSQVAIHKEYGGVFPALAKREHSKNLVPVLEKVLIDSQTKTNENVIISFSDEMRDEIEKILAREPELLKMFLEFVPKMPKPEIDMIAVTYGPGLEPALWVGVNFAKALSVIWDIPVIPTNHMEGHILVSLLQKNQESSTANFQLSKPQFPALALLLSGGHTEMVLIDDTLQYKIVGRTCDDAVGEAFDKVARIMGLPYPGGPEISKLAEIARAKGPNENQFNLPKPMMHSKNLDFSFSGLKTAVLYLVQKLPSPIPEDTKIALAREFEDTVTEVIIKKVKKAIDLYGTKTLILGGGVVANKNIRKSIEELSKTENIALYLPEISHSTDNALMISIAGYFNRSKAVKKNSGLLEIRADGNLSFPR